MVLESSFKGDGSFSEQCVIEVGGTKKWPMESEDTQKYYFTVRDSESLSLI